MRLYLRFLLTVVTPVSIALFLVWGWLVGAPPSAIPGSAPDAGVQFAALVSLRLAALGGIWQLSFLTIPAFELPGTLSEWGVRGSLLTVCIGVISLIPEIRLRAEQIITARQARGLMPNRRVWTRVMELPWLLRPLLTWTLRSAIQRADVWRQRDLLSRLAQTQHGAVGRSGGHVSMLLPLLSCAWLLCSIAARLLPWTR